ncbi:MAG TPA: hypothetical protein VGQ15_11755 [Gaiellaceae bacterium]|jgi:hypothetical protein|nr:hypothetical protein [Gaiellaceae bacterium]
MTELDRVLPTWHFRERHTTRVDAPAEQMFAAVREVTLAEMGVFRALARLRGIRAPADRPVLEHATKAGWRVLASEPGTELVYGAIGQPWRLRGGDSPAADFAAFDRPGYAKLAINWRLDGATLSTETRVLLTDDASRRAFRRYWLVIRPFSGLIRRVWLRAIARRAARREAPA